MSMKSHYQKQLKSTVTLSLTFLSEKCHLFKLRDLLFSPIIVKWHFDYRKEKWYLIIRSDRTTYSSRPNFVDNAYLISILELFCNTSLFNTWFLKIHANPYRILKCTDTTGGQQRNLKEKEALTAEAKRRKPVCTLNTSCLFLVHFSVESSGTQSPRDAKSTNLSPG